MNVKNQSVTQTRTVAEIKAWLVSYLADLLDMQPSEVDLQTPFERFGLDSAAAVGLSGDLEEWIGVELDPVVLYDYPTIEKLAQHLVENLVKA